ncbi:MAG: transglycosylase domain-containing protein [Clostridia bacterium]
MQKKSKKVNKNEKKTPKVAKAFLKTLSVAIKTTIAMALVIACVLGGLLIGVVAGCIITTDTLDEEDLYITGFTSYIYDADGNVIAELKGSDNINRSEVDIEVVPKHLLNAFIAIEDERFYTHPGVDVKRTVGAFLGYFIPGMSSHGGSTITQQMVKTITGDDARSVPRKIREQWRAYQLEKDLSKDEILELYINIIYMGHDLYGVKTAAKAYFEKDITELNLAECAFLAGITNNPGKYNPLTTLGRENAYKRQVIILDQMLKLDFITDEEYIEAIQTELVFNEDYRKEASANSRHSYFVDTVITDIRNDLIAMGYTRKQATNIIYNTGVHIYTTQNTKIQKIVEEEYCKIENFPINETILDPEAQAQSAIVVMDPRAGHVIAIYGGYGEKNKNLTFNRATSAYRQPGSAIKPLLIYGPQIDKHIITTGTVLEDKEVFLDPQRPDVPWPTNSGGWHAGLITARKALVRSSNICAILLYKDNVTLGLNYLKKLGIDRTEETQLAAGLGGFSRGVTPLQMAAAYSAFANSGMYIEPITYTKVVDRNGNVIINKTQKSHIVFEDDKTPYIMTSILNHVITDYQGTGGRAQVYNNKGEKIPTAGKTGTTNKNYDYWFCGYTPYYTAAVWYGYDNMKSITASEYGSAARLFGTVMSKIHADLEAIPFETSPDLVYMDICNMSGGIPHSGCYAANRVVKDEMFIRGTEPTEVCTYHDPLR